MRTLLLGLSLLLLLQVSAQKTAPAALDSKLDKLVNAVFKANGPGATVLVARNGSVIYRKAVGLADIERNVPMKPEMVFRIGSITKQFTAVAILQLMEEGKLSLQDELTKYIPDYPVKGKKITIEQLLTHISGIRSYTDMGSFDDAMQAVDKTPAQLMDVFKNEPFDFEPGTQWHYNNSGYFLLGMIIEKITGKPYGEFIETRLLQPLGMTASLYGSNTKLIPNRATGYDPAKNGVQVATYLSMTLPYAAGSLMSTVDDLFKWNRALKAGKLLKPETLEKAYTGYILPNGHDTHYGYGWFLGELGGQKVIHHSGGINGYLSDALYIPQSDLFVVALSNCTCNPPNDLVTHLAEAVLDIKTKYKQITVDSAALKLFTGNFENDLGEIRAITLNNGKLQSQRSGGPAYTLTPVGKDLFEISGTGSFFTFQRNEAGNIKGLTFKTGRQAPENWKRTDKPFTPARTEINLPEAELKQLEGEYQLTPAFGIVIRVKNGSLWAQATQQPEFELFAEAPDHFFLKVVDAQVEFLRDPNGAVTHLMLHQGGQHLKMKKIK